MVGMSLLAHARGSLAARADWAKSAPKHRERVSWIVLSASSASSDFSLPAARVGLSLGLACGFGRSACTRRRIRRSAAPRFAPQPPQSSRTLASDAEPSSTELAPTEEGTGKINTSTEVKRPLPRWAPGGKRTSIVPGDGGLGGMLDKMTEEVLPGDGRCYRVIYDLGIGIRDGPSMGAKRVGIDLKYGEVFEIRTEVRRAGRRFFQLLDGRGWAFDWTEIEGERVELVELAAQLYTVIFPDGVNGIAWGSETTLRFASVLGFTNDSASAALTAAGISAGDTLVMINEDVVVGMPFGQVLERIWGTTGKQPGDGLFYKVTTDEPYGIGIRDEPAVESGRTGVDLIRGTIFEVDEIVETEGGPTFLHLADQRGWVFDTSPIDPEHPSCKKLSDIEPGCTITMWRGEVDELAKTIGLKFKQDSNDGKPFQLTVLEEGQPIQRIPIAPGSNLRKALVTEGFQIYQDARAIFNCNAQQLCGTCILDVMEGGENLTVTSVNEQKVMAANPPSYRLACNIDVYGDVTVRLRPRDAKYGGGTS
eukprot:TRINITY_DN34787_c0_g1_i1.p1 TRINITY_DN34787_c0_g1~~TRINITY_DN34787_c0_g1_i1.p1  ORF type:complete len:536 (+),score=84.93 TRINITY_DN34787_c0_g1_i1:38-1645(+)